MPELPEVETVAKALGSALSGRTVKQAECISRVRFPFDAAAASKVFSGKTITGVRRRAKYILIDFGGTDALLAHLGMTGYFHVDTAAEPRHVHDRIVFRLQGGDELRFADARRFGFIKTVTLNAPNGFPAELKRLGPEPLERSFTGKTLLQRAQRRNKCPVKVFIMDQEAVVGVGNIYASEALFAAGIDPRRPASSLTAAEWNRTAAEIKAVLRKAIRQGGSTIRNYRSVGGDEGKFQRKLLVYGRKNEPCTRCGSTVEGTRQGGRSTFFCPACQS